MKTTMKKVLRPFIALLMSVCLIAAPGINGYSVSAAQTGSTGSSENTETVTTYQTLTNLYARTEPSTRSDSTKAFVMSKGTTFTSTGTVNDLVYGSSKKWACFTKNGKTYYSSADSKYLKVISTTSNTSATENSSQSASASETSSQSSAASSAIYTVNTSLNVRSGPGTSYSKLGVLSAGTKITVTETSVTSGKTWGKINYNSKAGWVSLAYCTKVSETASGSQTAAGSEASSGSGTSSGSETSTESKTSTESETVSGSGTNTSVYKTTANLNVRSGPGTSYSILGTLAKGTQITVTETSAVSGKTWGKLNYNGKAGWVSLAYCTLISSGKAADTSETSGSTTEAANDTTEKTSAADYKITASSLNIRKGPGTSYAKVGVVTEGTVVTVTETSLNGSTTWGKITYNNVTGWISLQYAALIDDGIASEGKPAYIDSLEPGTIISEEAAAGNIDGLFCSYKIVSGDAVYQRIYGKSYKDNDDISISELRYLKMAYYNFDHQIAVGEMIVNYQIAGTVLNVFKELYQIGYEIESMYLIDNYWTGDGETSDSASIEVNNTSCFCYRKTTGSTTLSRHALGLAIDINPQYNPYISSDGTCSHENAYPYLDRTCGNPHVIVKGDDCYNIFTKYGFTWGGNWTSIKDYQHFELKIS